MRVFTCDSCGHLVYFDNTQCLRCEAPLGYAHEHRDVISLTEITEGSFADLLTPTGTWQRCAASDLNGCNWLVPAGDDPLCASCVLTRTRPADEDSIGLFELVQSETAKRRLVFQLAELNLPIARRDEESGSGLVFDLLSSTRTKVVTGHDDGVITLDLAEADSVHREHLRLQLNEPYRTVLGHFRHEIGHYYWPILVHEAADLDACRTLFGDEREDYQEAVAKHYESDSETDFSWMQTHVSRYATMHPFEDWAETFAHYLHILDTLQTAESFGIGTMGATAVRRLTRRTGAHPTRPDGSASFGEVVDHWLELSYALNQISRSMGDRDLYPFVLPPAAIRKMAFVDHLVTAHAAPPTRQIT